MLVLFYVVFPYDNRKGPWEKSTQYIPTNIDTFLRHLELAMLVDLN